MRQIVTSLAQTLLGWAARRTLARTKPTIVGVTGSAGKTSTKDAIGFVLTRCLDRAVEVASGNLNSEFGLPLVILHIDKPEGVVAWVRALAQAVVRGLVPAAKGPSILVLEYGAERPGDIQALTGIAQPKVAVVTNIGPAHLEYFGTLDSVAREKSKLVTNVSTRGLVVLNGLDQFSDWMARKTRADVVKLTAHPGEFAKAAAAAVAEWFGIDAGKAHQVLEDWSPPPGRLMRLPGVRGSIIIDDTYNANPSSTTLALNTVRQLKGQLGATRVVSILGDMLELGPEEGRYHQGIGLLAQKVADVSILVGNRFAGVPADHWFRSPTEAAQFLEKEVAAGDLILVKGSQGMRMELVVEALLAEPERDRVKLVRQSPYWKSKPFVQP